MGDVRPLYQSAGADATVCTKGHVQHVLVPLSLFMERALKAICEEGFTAASYLQSLLDHDIEARMGSGWTIMNGWPTQRPLGRRRGR